MDEHPHVALYRGIHENFKNGEYQAMFDTLPTMTWHQIGGPTLHGRTVTETMSGWRGSTSQSTSMMSLGATSTSSA
jgi:hypothetical protein